LELMTESEKRLRKRKGKNNPEIEVAVTVEAEAVIRREEAGAEVEIGGEVEALIEVV
jgi:hypothetical protein